MGEKPLSTHDAGPSYTEDSGPQSSLKTLRWPLRLKVSVQIEDVVDRTHEPVDARGTLTGDDLRRRSHARDRHDLDRALT